ncbi:MAG: zf-HC2 domain-containing protein, partial [Planctomycetota bacterium]|nr:zf-HC2 domain-containing protein [Planctomycetota bacterium]
MEACGKIRDLLSEYLDGELDGRAAGEVRSHLASCESCRRELDRLQRVSAAVRALPRVPAPEGLARRVAIRLAAEAGPRAPAIRRRPPAARMWIPAAAAALLVLSVTISLMARYWREDVGRPLPDRASSSTWREREKAPAAEGGVRHDAKSAAGEKASAAATLPGKSAGAEGRALQADTGIGPDVANRAPGNVEQPQAGMPAGPPATGEPLGGGGAGAGVGSGRFDPSLKPEPGQPKEAATGAERAGSARSSGAMPEAARVARAAPAGAKPEEESGVRARGGDTARKYRGGEVEAGEKAKSGFKSADRSVAMRKAMPKAEKDGAEAEEELQDIVPSARMPAEPSVPPAPPGAAGAGGGRLDPEGKASETEGAASPAREGGAVAAAKMAAAAVPKGDQTEAMSKSAPAAAMPPAPAAPTGAPAMAEGCLLYTS